jgi:hypothetical protein
MSAFVGIVCKVSQEIEHGKKCAILREVEKEGKIKKIGMQHTSRRSEGVIGEVRRG